jgi:unsaturated chondroitin disaccharide hydrolase
MLSLADLTPDGHRWHDEAWRQVTAIIRSRYFTCFAGNDGHAAYGDEADPGIFRGCCYETHPGRIELVESAWGSFFLMAAVSALAGICEPNHC